jgi:hypothetical protein
MIVLHNSHMPGAARDPVSELFDAAARELLGRAYARPGQWVSTRLADPSRDARAYAANWGITDLLGPDRPTAGGRGLNAKTRWARAFVRAVYYQHRWYSGGGPQPNWRTARRTTQRRAGALRVHVGRRLPQGVRVPAGRRVSVMLARGGHAADAAVNRLPASHQYISSRDGIPGPRASDPALRDWS